MPNILNVKKFYAPPLPFTRQTSPVDSRHDNATGTVEIRWAGELIARKTGRGKISFTLAGGCNYEVRIPMQDGQVRYQMVQC